MNDELERLEEQQSYEEDSNDTPPSDIVAFNELRSCADLLRLYESKQMNIQPDFQREIVWSPTAQTRFIDSLTKQLPIPSMCISLDYKTNKRLVIDGLQRMQTIINFLSDDEFKLSNIDDVDERIAGKTVHTIKTKSKDIYERVQNVTIPVTVIRCDTSKKEHNEYLFTIFHRLNSGGAKLNNQEIRNCIYSGTFNNSLKEITKSSLWRDFIGFNPDKIYRFSNEEILLRVFAFTERFDIYNGRLSKFLNDYMYENRNIDVDITEQKKMQIQQVIGIIKNDMLDGKSAINIGKTTLEGLLYGVLSNIDFLNMQDKAEIKKMYTRFLSLPEFSVEELKEGLSAKEKVIKRLKAAKHCFSTL